jgi:hypothetical protein
MKDTSMASPYPPEAVSPMPESQAAPPASTGLARLLLPSLSDVLFIVVMAILFMSGSGWSQMLQDGESGTHIRTGDYILATRSVPTHDLYYFTSPKTPWYAWEWLADIIFSAIHSLAGLKGVVLFSGSMICLALTLLFRHMIWRGVGVHIAVLLCILVGDALKFHFLARPLVFTTVLAVAALWMLDRDWQRPGRAAWLLVPLAAVWANLHGGFVMLMVSLVLYAAAALLLRDRARTVRYAVLAVSCGAATLINPYGWQLHVHIWKYLRSDWLIKYIDEFQSPVFRGEGMFKMEILLFLGLICVLELARTRRYQEALLIVFWAHAALTSARHLTIYAIAAVPPVATQLNRLWDYWAGPRARGSVIGVLRDLARDLRPAALRTSLWVPAFLAGLAFLPGAGKWPTDFPPNFPTALVARNASLFAGPEHPATRVLNLDLWGGYLAYKFYPNRCAFLDGRSDYFGPAVAEDYLKLRSAGDGWEQVVTRYDLQYALVPPDWPLVPALKRGNQWVVRDQDKVAVLLERKRDEAQTLGRR